MPGMNLSFNCFLLLLANHPSHRKACFFFATQLEWEVTTRILKAHTPCRSFCLSTGCMECRESVLPVTTLGSSNTGSPGHWVAGSDEMLTQKSFLFLFWISNQDNVATEWFMYFENFKNILLLFLPWAFLLSLGLSLMLLWNLPFPLSSMEHQTHILTAKS